MFDGHPGHDVFPVDEIDTGNGAIGKKGKDFFVRVKIERHGKVLFFPESVDDFGCFSAGDGDESEGGMVFHFIPYAVNRLTRINSCDDSLTIIIVKHRSRL